MGQVQSGRDGNVRCELRDVNLQALARMGYQHLRPGRHGACISPLQGNRSKRGEEEEVKPKPRNPRESGIR